MLFGDGRHVWFRISRFGSFLPGTPPKYKLQTDIGPSFALGRSWVLWRAHLAGRESSLWFDIESDMMQNVVSGAFMSVPAHPPRVPE